MQKSEVRDIHFEPRKKGSKLNFISLQGILIIFLISISAVHSATPADGKTLFQKECTECHTIGSGDMYGPDLLGVTKRRDHDWLTRFITEPDKVISEGDPIATELLKKFFDEPMPNLGLKEEEIDSILLYLESQDGGASSTGKTTAADLPPGDPEIGRALFTGTIPFQNGAPECMTCHNIAGIGPIGGGVLGPSLSTSYFKFGEAGIFSILSSLSFPTMIPIYGEHALTLEEQSHLAVFFKETPSDEPQAIDTLLIYLISISGTLGVVGAIALLVLFNFVWRSRSMGVRRPLLRQKNSKKGGE